MTGALLATVALIGLAGTPHCAGMCGALCSAAGRSCGARTFTSGVVAVLLGRLLGYAFAGALAASVVMAVRWLSIGTGWLRPLWSALQFFMLGLGLWLLWRGRLPAVAEAWMERALHQKGPSARSAEGVRMFGPGEIKAVGVGALWPLIPCGLLQSALLMSSMASGPLEGAVLMAVFGLTSMLGVVAGSYSWARWLTPGASGPAAGYSGDLRSTWPVRLTGLVLVISAGWTLLHGMGLVEQAPWCA